VHVPGVRHARSRLGGIRNVVPFKNDDVVEMIRQYGGDDTSDDAAADDDG
jgi:hypothetical protein